MIKEFLNHLVVYASESMLLSQVSLYTILKYNVGLLQVQVNYILFLQIKLHCW